MDNFEGMKLKSKHKKRIPDVFFRVLAEELKRILKQSGNSNLIYDHYS